MRHAVYAGSFDPITNGHLWMIEHGSRLFDRLTVAIGINPDKKYRFSLEDRLGMLRESTAHLPNVRVADFENLFLVRYAKQISAGFILRGIRNEQDYDYERGMRYVNGEFDPNILSVFLVPPREYAEISSSFVKGLVGPSGWQDLLAKYVPDCVFQRFLAGAPIAPSSPFASPSPIARNTNARSPGALNLAAIVRLIKPGLDERYAEPHRHYHTLEHVRACLDLLESTREQFDDPDTAELAFWYHDAIYDSTRSDNEEASARLAKRELSELGVATDTVARVAALILATKHGSVDHRADASTAKDAALVSDIDLAILAADAEEFDRYERNVRREYAHLDDATFRAGRAAFLEKLLAHERIYQTDAFADRFEQAARDNLKRSITRSGAG